jgi:TonB family protein
VLHEEIPNVPLHSRETIHGHVKVIVRVTVDKSGTVVSDVLENPGPSRYFARVAGQAASKWKFAPADHETTRQWLVRFEFSRDGTKANAVMRN